MDKIYRTADEVKDMLEQLASNKLLCFPFDAFGSDNVAKIDTMRDVIQMNRSEAWINSKFLTDQELLLNEPDNELWQVALDARSWLNGKFEVSDLLFPERPTSDVHPAKKTNT
ncbi:MAG: hypothetical protein JKY70_02830 [Mucilaginibacter sp.]|nr:hypothetical protein [Mucilaginibacter sp.]